MLNSGTFCCLLLLFFVSNQAKSARPKGELGHDLDEWSGPWFPHVPYSDGSTLRKNVTSSDTPATLNPVSTNTLNQESVEAQICDDGVHSIDIDFDPADKRNSYNYLCLVGSTSERQRYEPNLQTQALLTEHFVPATYEPLTRCLNESLVYGHNKLPTFGNMRPLPPKYGRYKYLPPQRWMHSLAEGAIVMLYHPCSFPEQVIALQSTLSSCLYRHIVTPSQLLSAERPIALLAWGKSLELSVVDDKMVVDFIRQHANQGPLAHSIKRVEVSYDVALTVEAHLITDFNDTEICGYQELR